MKKIAENRYPHSATLFRFCKEALAHRYDGNVKVIDQDVGAILGYDPADCSHWKKGKKNIRALSTLQSIASHLDIDEKLLIDITAGRVGLNEALFEYRGYGQFALDRAQLDSLRKEYFRNPEKWRRDGLTPAFEELFKVDREKVVEAAEKILEAAQIHKGPVYIPEVTKRLEGVELVHDPSLEAGVVAESPTASTSSVRIRYAESEMRPYIRFLIAKELYKYLRAVGHEMVNHLDEAPQEITEIQANIFAENLLVPKNLLSREVAQIDGAADVIQQLAETFWVSKTLMNQRLRDHLTPRAAV